MLAAALPRMMMGMTEKMITNTTAKNGEMEDDSRAIKTRK